MFRIFRIRGRSFHRVLIVAVLSAMMLSSIASIAIGVAFYQPSSETASSEQTSNFLASDTDAYFSFNLKPGLTQSTGFDHFISFFEDDFLEEVEDRFGSMFADIVRGIDDVTQLVGPELAAATLYTDDSAGIVFFIQAPPGQEPEDLLALLLLAPDMLVDGDATSSEVDGVTKIERSIGPVTETEYYATAGDYLVGAIGNVTLADFQTIKNSIPGGAPSPLSANANFMDVRSNLPSERMGLGYISRERMPASASAVYDAVTPYLPYFKSSG